MIDFTETVIPLFSLKVKVRFNPLNCLCLKKIKKLRPKPKYMEFSKYIT